MPFFWIDLEMTGLDETKDSILEVAAVITDHDFKMLEEFHRIVFQPNDVLEKMNDWCKKHHIQSGLVEKVKTGAPLADVEKELLALAGRYYKEKEEIVLCGNSIGNDRRFLERYMPAFCKRLHYRLIDVSSFKEVFRTKYGIKFEKKNKHRAVDDIYESIEELKTYLSYVKVTLPSSS